MKENRKLLKEVLKDIRHDMTDEEVLNLLADSKISVSPESEKEKYTLGQRAADSIAKFAGSWAFIFSFTGVLILWMWSTRCWLPKRLTRIRLFFSIWFSPASLPFRRRSL